MAISRLSFLPNTTKPSTITPPSGKQRYLMILTSNGDTSDNITSITYNDKPMSLIVSATATASAQVWGLAIPDDWTGALTITFVGGSRIEIAWFENVDPYNPILNYASDSSGGGTDTSATCTVICNKDGWVQTEIGLSTATNPIKSENQTSDFVINSNASAYLTTPITDNVIVSYTFTESRNAMVAVSLMPYITSGNYPIWFE